MKALVLTLLASLTLAFVAAAATPLTPGNVVISDPFHLGQWLLEYRPDGTLVQTIQIPQPSYGGSAGGIAFDDQCFLWVYNGTWEPYLSSWDPLNIWTHQSCAGWSSFQCFPCQGIGTFGNFVFATDEGAYGNPNGLVRFDRGGTNACVRFADGRNYSALAVGLDGVLYGRRADDVDPPPPTVIDAFDPTTLGFIKSVTLSERSLSIAADAHGQLYGASGQSILHYSADGSLLDTHQVITNGFLYTLALSADGQFVVVSSDGEVVIADRTFTPLNGFRILTGSWAYAAIIPPRPSPSNYAYEYLPLVPGTIWRYLKNGEQTAVRKVLNKKVNVRGVATSPVKFIEENVTEYVTSDSDGIFLHRQYQPHIYVGGVGWVDIDVTSIPPIKLADGEVWIGQSFHSSGTARTLVLPLGQIFNFDYTADSTIEAEETITVPAGTFDTIRYRESITLYDQTLSATRYLAKGIGIVKDVATNPQGKTATFELVSMTSLTLLSPNAGEVLPSGGTYDIMWKSTPDMTTFQLTYSLDNGVTWISISGAENVNENHYLWAVPIVAGNKRTCRLKVTGYNAANIKVKTAISDAPFTIEVVNVTLPKAEDILVSGETAEIKWTTYGAKRTVAKVKLSYTRNGGVTWIPIPANVTGNPETYLWTVPDVTAIKSKCKVKVVLQDEKGISLGSDITDGFFSITP